MRRHTSTPLGEAAKVAAGSEVPAAAPVSMWSATERGSPPKVRFRRSNCWAMRTSPRMNRSWPDWTYVALALVATMNLRSVESSEATYIPCSSGRLLKEK